MGYKANYKLFIEENLRIVDKNGELIPFVLNEIQSRYVTEDSSDSRDVVLKARQQGFSSVILAIFTADFILRQNSRSVIVADIDDNATELLDRVKLYLKSYEEINKCKIPLKYNSKYELYNELMNSRYTIGTAKNAEFGRSKTITNLHMSEYAFYNNAEKILAGALQAVTPTGRAIIETTANGFNYFKEFWTASKRDETGFKALFYRASEFYSPEFLEQKRKELGRLYLQEYPERDLDAFVTSGDSYFNKDSLSDYLNLTIDPMKSEVIYGI